MNIQPVPFSSRAQESLQMLSEASFLNSLDGKKINTMIINWGALGGFWRIPVFVAAVRKSRFTHALIEKTGEFSVTVPNVRPSQQVIDICGLPYHKDHNKLMEAGLKAFKAQKIDTPLIALPGVHFECKVVFQASTSPQNCASVLRELWYSKEPADEHTFFFGHIVASYRTE